jgi:hypothetical protein
MVEAAALSPGKDFVKSFHEYVEVLMVCRGGNKASQFLEVATFAESSHRGCIWLHEGRTGWGWRCTVDELRKFLHSLEATFGSPTSEKGSMVERNKGKVVKDCLLGRYFGAKSFAEVVCAVSCVKPSLLLALKMLRMAVNCFDLEE